MRHSLLALFVLFSDPCRADETSLSIGAGVAGSMQSRFIGLSYQKSLPQELYIRAKGGFWLDPAGAGRTGSGYAFIGPGVTVDLQPVVFRVGVAMGAISSPDALLGGPFPQFNEEIYCGLKDKIGNSIGISYNHISSAGIYQQNMGRDFISIELGQELW